MSIFSGLEQIVEEHYPLARSTWYGLGGEADYFIRPESVEQLSDVVTRCRENNLPIRVLGFGSNLLISDAGVKGAVVKFDASQFVKTEFNGGELTAWAGAELSELVLECVRKGLAGMESLTGIPGSMGGSVKMNAGGSFGDIGTVIDKVTLMDANGKVFEKSKPELIFDYRNTNITAPFILSATITLDEADPDQILKTVKEIWAYKKNHQPLNTKNAGCVFKNPRGLSAGAIIDRAGLKGESVGGAQVSEKHANFIVAKAGCTSRDVLQLIDKVREKVKEHSDIELELELEIWD